MQTPTIPPETQSNLPLPVPKSILWRIFYAFVVSILTVAAFMAIVVFEPEWQSGKLSAYVVLLLSPKSSWIFAPLITYSSLSMFFLLGSPVKWAQTFWVRLGIYTGFLLALQFSILALIVVDDTAFIVLMVWVGPLVAWPIVHWLARKFGGKWAALIVIITFVLLYLLYILINALTSPFPEQFLFLLVAAVIASAPFWSLLIMGVTGYGLLKHYETGARTGRPGLAGRLRRRLGSCHPEDVPTLRRPATPAA